LPTGDEKGSGGGGGGGSCHIMALDRIVFGPNGQVRARGGTGGGGENTIFLNRVGGGSGGGSGGHVVIQSATHIDLRAKSAVVLSQLTNNSWAVDARGGQGGAGSGDLGGATVGPNGAVETLPLQDACPPGYPTSGANACRGHVDGAGGDGGPGIVQFHTPRGAVGSDPFLADILVAPALTLEDLSAPAPLFGRNTPTQPAPHFVTNIGAGVGLIELDSDDCDANGVPDRYEIQLHPALDVDQDGILDVCDASLAYCFGNQTSAQCAPALQPSGIASASAVSGFDLLVDQLDPQRSAGIFYGLAPQTLPIGNQTICVAGPFQRTGLAFSGGAGACSGQITLDWNAWRTAHPSALGSPFATGQALYAQAWERDPLQPQGVSLSSALRFLLAP
jgi:hypothetical protein